MKRGCFNPHVTYLAYHRPLILKRTIGPIAVRRRHIVIGKQLHHYKILKKVGAGGQGAVYTAIDTKLNRTVVIKVLPPELVVRKASLARFKREAYLASSLDHPNICAIYDLDFAEDVHFIAMQYVEGKNVRELVNGHPLELKSALSIAIQVCDALAAAHAQGIMHRDIKANNVMVTSAGQVKLLDFGLAKLVEDEEQSATPAEQTHLTEFGIPYGTATYAAPEQARGERADHRSDIFSTGVLLYEMLTGIWAFQGKTTVEVRYAVLNGEPKPLSEARPTPVPNGLQEVLDRALKKDPADRYQKVTEMRDELRVLLRDLSLTDDPDYLEDSVPSVPRHLGLGGHPQDAWARLMKDPVARWSVFGVALIVVAALVAVPIWFWMAGKPTGAVVDENIIIRMHGSNTIGAKLAPALAEEFFKLQGAKDVSIVYGKVAEEMTVIGTLPGETFPSGIDIRSHGSGTAFVDLKDGKSDIGLSSRRVEPTEAQSLTAMGDMTSPGNEHIVGLDGIAVIVNRANQLDSLTREQIADIFSGRITTWTQLLRQGGEIKIYARDDKSGTYDSFKSLVLGSNSLSTKATRFEDSDELSDAVAQDPDGIGFVGLPYIRDAKAIAVSEGDAIALMPNRLTVATEDYLLSRRLYLYSPSTPRNDWVRRFIDFALSKNGQEVVAKTGFVAQNVESVKASTVENVPVEYKKLTTGAERLSLNFRFQKGGTDLDNKAQMDLDRAVNFLMDLNLSGQNLVLLGFANDEKDPEANLKLSKERAAGVAEHLKRRGVVPATISGFGPDLPVASDATEEGRSKNRRVELWLRR